MSPKAFALIVIVVVAAIALVVWLMVWWLGRQAGVRRVEFERLRNERNLFAQAVAAIDEKADTYRDIDSVLATDIRAIIRNLNAERMDLGR
jgi:hypothetical protein